MKTRNILIGCLALAACLLLTGSVAFGLSRIPPVSEQVPQNAAPLLVTLTDPEDGTSYTAYSALSVAAEAISARPLQALELWVDGTLQGTRSSLDPSATYMTARWDWVVPSPAIHSLLVRAVDTAGQIGLSNVVRIEGMEPRGHNLLYTPQQGDTLDSLAQNFGTTADQILASNPGLSPSDPLSVDQEIFVPIPPLPPLPPPPEVPSTPPTEPGGAAPASGGNAVSFWLDKNIFQQISPSGLPSAPALSSTVEGCGAKLVITDAASNESGFFVYRLDPGAAAFQRIATLGAQSSALPFAYLDSGIYGPLQYYVSAFNAAGESASTISSVKVADPACAPAAGLTLDQLVPAYPANLEHVYFYISVNDGEWTRLPADPDTFLDPAQGTPDLGQYLKSLGMPPQEELSLHGEAWGWSAGTLTFLGEFQKNLKGSAPVSPPVGLQGLVVPTDLKAAIPGTSLESTTELTINKFQELWFLWFRPGHTTQVLWQISTSPFPSNPAVTPPNLVLTGLAEYYPIWPQANDFRSRIIIDFVKVLPFNPMAISVVGTPTETAPSILQFGLAQPPFSLEDLLSTDGVTVNPSAGISFEPAASGEARTPSQAADYYVRVLPMKGNQPVGEPSNTVIVHYNPSAEALPTLGLPPIPPIPPEVIHYDLEITEFSPLKASLWNHVGCIVVTGYDEQQLSVWGQFVYDIKGSWSIGSLHCPDLYKGGSPQGWDGFVKSLKDAVDFVADLYQKLTDFVVDLVDMFNPICIQAKFVAEAVDAGQGTVKDVCHAVAKMTVEAAKAYVGLPPSLPNYDQLMNMGQDYLVDLAAKELEAKGIPCPQQCKDLMKQGLDASVQAVNQAKGSALCSEQAAHDQGFEPLCPPAGVLVKPDPLGSWQEPYLVLKVTRRPGSDDPTLPQPTNCAFGIHSPAENTSYVGSSYPGDYQGTPQPLSGELFKKAGGPIPILPGGQSVTIPLVLQQISAGYLTYPHPATGWWLPGHEKEVEEQYAKYGDWPAIDDWIYFYVGAKVKLTATGQCKLAGYDEYYSSVYAQDSGNYQPPGATMQGQEQTYGPLQAP